MPLLLAAGELSLSTGSHGFSLTNPQTIVTTALMLPSSQLQLRILGENRIDEWI